MKLVIGSDHAGFEYKVALIDHLEAAGHDVKDVGCFSLDSVDYPDFGHATANSVATGESQYGVLICGSGIGISIAANKVHGIRAANCVTVQMAELSRQHNNANIIAVGSRIVDLETAKAIVDAFLDTAFEGGRHERRVEKIELETNP